MGTSEETSAHLAGSQTQINGVTLTCPLSPLSDPPDVRNYYSSYVYESPSQETSFLGSDIESFAHDDASDVSFVKSTSEKSVEKNLVEKARKKEGILLAEENGFVHNREDFSPDNSSTSNDTVKEKSAERNPSLQLGKESVLQHQTEVEHILNCCSRELSEEDEFEKTNKVPKDTGGSSECAPCVPAAYGFGCYNEQKNKPVCGFGLKLDVENSNGCRNRWISTKSFRDCPQDERGSRKQNSAVKRDAVDSVQKVPDLLRKRDVLVDQTNIVPGKWHCPGKSKPYLGPPMKQLRLEHWVHRATKNTWRF